MPDFSGIFFTSPYHHNYVHINVLLTGKRNVKSADICNQAGFLTFKDNKIQFSMKRIYAISILSTLVFSMAIFSCSKDDNNVTTPTPDENNAVELTKVKVNTDAFFDDVSMELLTVNTEAGLTSQPSTVQGCATITISSTDPNVWPKTVTIDYGTAGCTGVNGYVKKGMIIYTLNKKLSVTGAILNASFDNFTVNGYKLEGIYSITNNGSANGLNASIKLAGGKVTYPDGKFYTKETNTTWIQSAGVSTITILDDEFDVTGTGTITSSTGNVLTAATNGNLHRTVVCTNTVSGLLNLTFNNISGTLDFGAGTCDKSAVLTVAGKTYPVILP